jgi:hypothetical protein
MFSRTERCSSLCPGDHADAHAQALLGHVGDILTVDGDAAA